MGADRTGNDLRVSLIAHGGSLLLGVEVAGAGAVVGLASTVRSGLRRAGAVWAGLAIGILAAPPLHGAADRSVGVHMVQHLGLTMLVAPVIAFVMAGSSLQRTGVVRRCSSMLVRPASAPLVAGVASVVVMSAWHLPAAYDLAVDVWWVHLIEHVTMLATATWWWTTALHHGAGRNPILVVVSLGGVAAIGAGVGVLLMFAPDRLYASQRDVADLQVAGALLTASGMIHGLAAFALVVRMLTRMRRPRPLPHVAVVALASLVAAGLLGFASRLGDDGTVRAGPVAATAGAADAGRELYRRDCASCHGVDGGGTSRGVALDDRGPASVHYVLSTGRMPIDHPDQRIERRPPRYTAREIEELVAYAGGFGDGPSVPLESDAASLARGGELYRLHCAACHGATGIGGTQAFTREAPSVLHADGHETVAAVVAGPGGMPSFRTALDDDELWGIAGYVTYLQDPERRGWSLGGGRVGEGLIAWVVGMGALASMARWIAGRP
jgi:ubiquinol-cytochrome c reductase cytochrome c subunit